MPFDAGDKAYLWDMLDSALAIEGFVGGKSWEEYQSNRMMRSAVERHIEIIGKAARRISDATRQSHPEVPWRAIVGQRNVLAHQYDEVVHEAIWAIATRRIPELIAAIRLLLPDQAENELPPE
jgi:uncharacterized protein with HEPN domain